MAAGRDEFTVTFRWTLLWSQGGQGGWTYPGKLPDLKRDFGGGEREEMLRAWSFTSDLGTLCLKIGRSEKACLAGSDHAVPVVWSNSKSRFSRDQMTTAGWRPRSSKTWVACFVLVAFAAAVLYKLCSRTSHCRADRVRRLRIVLHSLRLNCNVRQIEHSTVGYGVKKEQPEYLATSGI